MFSFLIDMDPLQRGFWWVAIVASLIFIIQTVFTLLGSDSTDGINADFDGHLDAVEAPFQLFSFRNLVNFLLGFGWGGIAFFPLVESETLVLLIAVIIGIVFVLLYFVIIKQILKLAEDNTFDIRHIVSKNGQVYLTIPGNREGTGKINISHKGTSHELNAITEGEAIKTGEIVRVIQIENSVLIVEKV